MWLKELRNSVNITQEDLAARLQSAGFNYSRSTINNWENKRGMPPIDDPKFAESLAWALRVKVPTLLKAAGFDIKSQHTEVGERVATLVDSLTDEKKYLALRIVETIAEV